MIARNQPHEDAPQSQPGVKRSAGEASETSAAETYAAYRPASRRAHQFVWAFGVFMVLLAGGGFLFKLYEFLTVFTSSEPMKFAVIPVMTYLIVASGFGCLFLWAYLSGQFKDIEGPKYRMLQMQDEIDAMEGKG